MSVVIGGWSTNGRGCGATGTGMRGGHGGRLKGAAVKGPWLEGTPRGPVTLGQRGRRRLQNTRDNVVCVCVRIQHVSTH